MALDNVAELAGVLSSPARRYRIRELVETPRYAHAG
jgi:hypothetical protein